MTNDPKDQLSYKKQIEGVMNALPATLPAVCVAIAAAVIVALLLGSSALLNWTNNLPIGPVSDFLLNEAQNWQDFLARYGVAAFSDALKTWPANFQAMKW